MCAYGCKAAPSICPKKTKPEVIAQKLPWPTRLLGGTPTRDAIEGIELEVKCSNGTVLYTYTGTLAPEVATSSLEFDAGAGELEGPLMSHATITGVDKLKGPKKDTLITVLAV